MLDVFGVEFGENLAHAVGGRLALVGSPASGHEVGQAGAAPGAWPPGHGTRRRNRGGPPTPPPPRRAGAGERTLGETHAAPPVRCSAWFGPASAARLTTPTNQATNAHQQGTEQADPCL